MAEVRITCINKDNGDHYDPHEAITHLGWTNESNGKTGKTDKAGMIKYLEDGHNAYVKDMYNRKAYLVNRISRYNNKYLKTVADGRETNNLLELRECV